MSHLETIIDFLEPINTYELSDDQGYKNTQLGKHIEVNEEYFPELEEADLVLVGCGETRGAALETENSLAPNAIRKQFYSLYQWHPEVKIADVGNVKAGATLQDTYAAL